VIHSALDCNVRARARPMNQVSAAASAALCGRGGGDGQAAGRDDLRGPCQRFFRATLLR
jgi:hypothetical protein